MSIFNEFLNNFAHNLFKPLLLFFYAGFLIPILRVKLEFPKPAYQALTIFLLLGIGWHGGEELASLDPSMYGQAIGFMIIGFFTNLLIGIVAFLFLRWFTKIRQIDAATIAGYYGSDSAGTFVTAVGFLGAANIAFASYMPVMLAVMEIPGCVVALYLVSRMRAKGMDIDGNMPGEEAYALARQREAKMKFLQGEKVLEEDVYLGPRAVELQKIVAGSAGIAAVTYREVDLVADRRHHYDKHDKKPPGVKALEKVSLSKSHAYDHEGHIKQKRHGMGQLVHEVLLNQGIFLLFAGIIIGFISRIQGEKVVGANDRLFIDLFPPLLCLFLLEMGITASKKLKDLRTAGWKLVAFGVIAPNIFATFGMLVALAFSILSGQPLEQGTYVLFAVLCGAASYIALPAVQQMAIPEASPTLPLASSLGLTFSYNVTIGISLYVIIAKYLMSFGPQLIG